ncbi:MAG: PEP-CTERM sorting domain-containing protein [Sphingomonas sp.]|nr:PEP-CTERM sorting domain-containing protein [Sphingomonas sp.]
MGALATPASASTIVNTGAGPNVNGGYVVSSGQWLGGKFQVGAATTITDVLGWITSFSGSYTASIYSDSNGLPNASLYSANFTPSNTSQPAWYGVSGQAWNVAAGTYWAVFSAGTGNGAMPIGVANPLSAYAGWHSGQGFYDAGNLNIGFQILGDATVAAVPEPAIWAMMMLGFGAMGYTLRRRAKVTTRVRFA